MKPVLSLVLLLLLTVLSACGGTLSVAFDEPPAPAGALSPESAETRVVTLAAQPAAALPVLDADSDPETLRRALLESHENWQSLWADGLILYNTGAANNAERVQIWVDQPSARFRVLSGPADGQPERAQLSDGQQQARIDLQNAARQVQDVSPAAREANWRAPLMVSDTIEPHPLDLEIDSLISEIIFPAALAQRGGSWQVEGFKQLAGRPALYATWWWDGQMRQSFWIDAQTALILRMDAYEKQGDTSQPVYTVLINEVYYDLELPAELFRIDLAEKPRFALNPLGWSGPAPEPPPATYSAEDGALYFVIRGAEGPQLAWLPGGCADGRLACPAPQIVGGYPNIDSNLNPLVWSQDRRSAALVVDGSLFVHRPDSGEWGAVALFPILVGQPLWSPDASWLVFSVMDGEQFDVYAVQPDGVVPEDANLHSLSGLIPEVDNVWLEGWLPDGRLLLSLIQGGQSRAYALPFGPDASGGLLEPVAGLENPYRVLGLTPDGRMIAYSAGQDGAAHVELVTYGADGRYGSPRRLASFQNSGVAQILIAPAGQGAPWVALLVRGGANEASAVSTLYAIRADGSDLRQLYQSADIARVDFSADGARLVVEGGDGRLVIVPLEGAAHLLDAPGLRLDQPLSAASWR